jgi:sec-independent protein translocase protein TatA
MYGTSHWPYIFIVLVIVLIIWGPGKLPEMGAGMGRAIREFRKATSDARSHFVDATSSEPEPDARQPHPAEEVPASRDEVKTEQTTGV